MVTGSSFDSSDTRSKILFDHSTLTERLDEWRREGLHIGFTNGCFDLIHPGHIRVIEQARAACDRLVLGLNSDASVARLNKGPSRPVMPEKARARVLAAFAAVDLVVLFNEDTPLELIRIVQPSILVKGADYRGKEVVGQGLVEARGGRVVLVDLEEGFSTTLLLERIQQLLAPHASEG